MQETQLIPHLFRTEYSKITAVLGKLFGFRDIGVAEDIASDTFLAATETWGLKGLPENPTAWLYAVAKNKARDHLRRVSLFEKKISGDLAREKNWQETDIDLSDQNIHDSQLQMMFAICQPCISTEAQIGLSLRILCGFGIDEIADAFLTNKETINKRLYRAREKLREENTEITMPTAAGIRERLEAVLTTLYLLFNEGYYSAGSNIALRKDLCLEAMRLTHLLTENEQTATSGVFSLLALMCFHSSRFEARLDQEGRMVPYEEQDTGLWNQELIQQGKYYMQKASQHNQLSPRYALEAAIAFCHTSREDTPQKWERILQFYNQLLRIEYSPIAALNRTYALARANSPEEAIREAEKLQLNDHYLYHSLLGHLYTGIDNAKACSYLERALQLARSEGDKRNIADRITKLGQKD